MGVLGLTSYMRGNEPGERCDLRDCEMIIDGSSLSVQLYRASSARKRAAFNGDYIMIESTFKSFFQSLKRCNITPYVICDGGYDRRKLKTAMSRLRARTRDAGLIDPKTAQSSDLLMLPLMLRDVFFRAMTEMNIKFIVCEREADQEIAIVARYLNAPVLSLDSDFYIYNVSYIPIHSIDIKSPVVVKEGKAVFECDLCKPGDFAKKYRIKAEVLPLLATLLGNDYVKRATFSKFFKNLSFNEKKTKNNLGQCRIFALLQWLQNETFHSALEKVLTRFKSQQQYNIQRLILKSCSIYSETRCKSLHDLDLIDTYANEKESISEDEEIEDSSAAEEVEENDDILLPSLENDTYDRTHWLLEFIKKGKISPRYLEMLNYSIYIGSPQVEDRQCEDAHAISFPILRYSYDVMKKFSTNSSMSFIGRKSSKVTNVPIQCKISPSIRLQRKLNDTNPPDETLFLYFLERTIPRSVLNGIKKQRPDLQSLLLTIVWIKSQPNSKMFLNDCHVYSLLLCCITLTIICDTVGNIENSASFNKKHTALLQNRKNNIKKSAFQELCYEDCVVSAAALFRYFEVNAKLSSNLKHYDRKTVHTFAQFLCCFQHLNYLNIMTSETFHSCAVSRIFHGTFLYNLYSDLNRRNDALGFISNILNNSPSIYNYFISTLNILNSVNSKKPRFVYSDLYTSIESIKLINVTYVILVLVFILFVTFYMWVYK